MAHPKGVLLERAAKLGFERPEFRTERTGPEHEPQFLSDVIVDGEVLGTGQGGSKRTAETRAAEEALAQLDGRSGAGNNSNSGSKATNKASGKSSGARAGKAPAKPAANSTAKAATKAATKTTAKATARPTPERSDARSGKRHEQQATTARGAAKDEESGTMATVSDEEFDGPWPLFDDLLAAVLQVAERRVSGDLRGEEAREAIRDFSLDLYKELLSDLGEVVDDEDDDDEDDD